MSKPISIDVLLWWYKAAMKCIERGLGSYHPHDAGREQRQREAYEMAKKTVAELSFLEDYAVDVDVIEPTNTGDLGTGF